MNSDELKKLAVEKAIDILAKHNLNYRRLDFNNNRNKVVIINDSVVIELSYLYGGKRGKKLKSIGKILGKENKNVSPLKDYIVFQFYFNELEVDGKTSDDLTVNIPANKDVVTNNNGYIKEDDDNINRNDISVPEIETTDMIIIGKIAKKYNISLKKLAQIISQKSIKEKDKILHIRFTEEELKAVDEKAKKENMSRSGLCRYACFKIIKEYKNNDMELQKIRDKYGKGDRKVRVCVSFADEDDQRKIKDFADGLSLPVSTFVRYCMLRL